MQLLSDESKKKEALGFTDVVEVAIGADVSSMSACGWPHRRES